MTTQQATRTIRGMLGDARIFGATFIKANGEERTGSFRLGVDKRKGGSLNYDPESRGNLIVWDMNARGYRTIPLDRVKVLRVRGREIVL